MVIYDKLTIAGSTIIDGFNIKLNNSVSTNNSSSTFEVDIDNFDGKNATTYTVGDEVIIFADKDVPRTIPIAHYKMNDNLATTNIIDSIDNGNDGTLVGGDNTEDLSITGKINKALKFNGIDDYVSFSTPNSLKPIVNRTYSLWFYPTINTESTILGGNNGGDGNILRVQDGKIGLHNAGTWTIILNNVTATGVTSDSGLSVNLNQWNYLVVYQTVTTTWDNFYIAQAKNNRFFEGRIDDVRIYNKVLSSDEISLIFNSGNGTEKVLGDSSTKIFTGILETIKFPSKGLKEKVIYSGRDFSARLMDRTVEPEVYSNLLAGSIVKDIINKYTDDITVTNVDDSTTTISRIAFTQKPVYDAIKELADLAEFTFFVDENKDLNFKLKSETSSGKTFSSGNVISANIKEKRDTVFNEIWVYGGRYLDSFREEFTAGSPLGGSVFTLQNRPHNTNVDVGSPLVQSTRQKGGILGMNIIPPSGTDYLVDFFDKNIVFISGTTIGYDSIPSSGTLVTIDYQRSLPIVKVGQNSTSVATYGKRIKVITDSEIKDPTTAQEILERELEESSLPKKQGTIKVDGLATITAGQTAIVDLPNQNINNQTYEILEVKHEFNKENNLTEQVLTLKVNKKIDDVTDTIKNLIGDIREIRADSLSISDVLTRFQFTTGSFGIRTSGLFINSRTLGSSFILGKGFHGVTEATFGGILGSVVASGINFLGDSRSSFTIEFSGGFPTV